MSEKTLEMIATVIAVITILFEIGLKAAISL